MMALKPSIHVKILLTFKLNSFPIVEMEGNKSRRGLSIREPEDIIIA